MVSPKDTAPDRIIAYIWWLQEPMVGHTVYLVERAGRMGYVPATGKETIFEMFFDCEEPEALRNALAVHDNAPGHAPGT